MFIFRKKWVDFVLFKIITLNRFNYWVVREFILKLVSNVIILDGQETDDDAEEIEQETAEQSVEDQKSEVEGAGDE